MQALEEIISRPSIVTMSGSRHHDGAATPEAIMLAELQHRMANELALASATLQLARRHVAPCHRSEIDDAVVRLGDQARLARLLLPPLREGPVDLGGSIEKLCLGLSRTRLEQDGIAIMAAAAPIDLPGRACWALCAIVAELVLNAAKHAFEGAQSVRGIRGSIRVDAYIDGVTLTLRVADDGVGEAVGGVTVAGQGSAVLSALVASLHGDVERVPTNGGTTVEVRMPMPSRYGAM